MSLSTSPDVETDVGAPTAVAARPLWQRAVFPVGVTITAALFFAGAWERRWIADDGLIVLRTVRNLLAGNGPVFNAGERVEANTSTIWTYLVYAISWITQARLEYVVLGIALTLSVAAIVLAMLGSRRLWTGGLASPAGTLLLPGGALVYIAVPPARDYATSGLETSLVLCWLALLWLLLLRWAQRDPADFGIGSMLTLAFVAGLGPLVRPEMLLVAAMSLLLIFLAPHERWTTRVWIVVAAGIVPVGYQIWRMGYYGLPYPNTAVAKDAAGSKWAQGFLYLENLVVPYFLWLPLLVLLAAAIVAFRTNGRIVPLGRVNGTVHSTEHNERTVHSIRAQRLSELRTLDWRVWQATLRSPMAVVALVLFSGLLLGLYTMRVGGDFMHGRTLLPVLFCLLLPVAVVPLRLPQRGAAKATVVVGVAWVVTLVWAVVAANTTGMATGTTIGKSGIADERAFYVLNTGHDHPILAEDYLDYPRMRAMVKTIADTPNGGLLLAAPAFTYWDVVPPPLPLSDEGPEHTVYFLNLGMTSMNVPLDVRVIDQEGLAYPLAAHSDRLLDGRIGHDKALYPDWVVADLNLVDKHPWLPWYLDEDWITEAKTAIGCPQTQELLTSYRSELTFDRWKQNLKSALNIAKYRFDRVPKYEIQRCKLTPPPLQRPN